MEIKSVGEFLDSETLSMILICSVLFIILVPCSFFLCARSKRSVENFWSQPGKRSGSFTYNFQEIRSVKLKLTWKVALVTALSHMTKHVFFQIVQAHKSATTFSANKSAFFHFGMLTGMSGQLTRSGEGFVARLQ